MRAAQSKGKVDLLALWPESWFAHGDGGFVVTPAPVWLVQCKTGSARMSPADRDALRELAEQTGAVPVLAEPGKNGRGVIFTNLRNLKEIPNS